MRKFTSCPTAILGRRNREARGGQKFSLEITITMDGRYSSIETYDNKKIFQLLRQTIIVWIHDNIKDKKIHKRTRILSTFLSISLSLFLSFSLTFQPSLWPLFRKLTLAIIWGQQFYSMLFPCPSCAQLAQPGLPLLFSS